MGKPLNNDQRELYLIAISEKRTHDFCVALRIPQLRTIAAVLVAFAFGIALGLMK